MDMNPTDAVAHARTAEITEIAGVTSRGSTSRESARGSRGRKPGLAS